MTSFNWHSIKSGLQEKLGQGFGSVRKSARSVKTKTGQVTRSGIRQLGAFEKKSKEQLKRVFRRSA